MFRSSWGLALVLVTPLVAPLVTVAGCDPSERPPPTPPADAGPGPRQPVVVQVAVADDGLSTQAWIDLVGAVFGPQAARALQVTPRPLTDADKAWLELFQRRIPIWAISRTQLEVPFGPGPQHIEILIGNQGTPDAFTNGERVIGLNLAQWAQAYGDAAAAESPGRVDRILSHEYTHLLTHAWSRQHPVDRSTALNRALWTLYHEGFGNYRSLSDAWLPQGGASSTTAAAALDRLSPVFVKRLTELAHTTDPAREAILIKGIADGEFESKWGALPVALWLALEAKDGEDNLRTWADAGPAGIVELATAHLPPALADELRKGLAEGPPPAKAPTDPKPGWDGQDAKASPDGGDGS